MNVNISVQQNKSENSHTPYSYIDREAPAVKRRVTAKSTRTNFLEKLTTFVRVVN